MDYLSRFCTLEFQIHETNTAKNLTPSIPIPVLYQVRKVNPSFDDFNGKTSILFNYNNI